MLIMEESFLVVLDSRNATQYLNGSYNSDVIFNIQEPITCDTDIIQMTLGVVSFICPCSFYQINYTNDILNIVLNGIAYTIIIPDGNYQPTNFISTLIGLLPSGFSVTLNQINNKFTITHSTYSFSIIGTTSTIYEVMGFSNASLVSSTGLTMTLPYSCNFSGLNNINVHIANITNNNIDSWNELDGNLATSIPVNSPPNGVIIYESKTDFKYTIRDSIINHLHIDIKDDLENSIDFSNQHWNLTLCFRKKYEKQMTQTTFLDIMRPPLVKWTNPNDLEEEDEEIEDDE